MGERLIGIYEDVVFSIGGQKPTSNGPVVGSRSISSGS